MPPSPRSERSLSQFWKRLDAEAHGDDQADSAMGETGGRGRVRHWESNRHRAAGAAPSPFRSLPGGRGMAYFALRQSMRIPPRSPMTMSKTIRFMIMSIMAFPASLLPAEPAASARAAFPG